MPKEPGVWRKASRSENVNNCVEVAELRSGCAVRDTKDRDGGRIDTSPTAWRALLTALR